MNFSGCLAAICVCKCVPKNGQRAHCRLLFLLLLEIYELGAESGAAGCLSLTAEVAGWSLTAEVAGWSPAAEVASWSSFGILGAVWFLRDEAQHLDEMMMEHPWRLTQVVVTLLEEHHPGLG